MDIHARNAFAFDLRHVAGDALASRAAVFMVGVRFETRHVRPVRRHGAMTVQTDLVRGLDKLRVVSSSMHIVAIEACDAVPVHHALREIVPLHAVLMRRAVRKVIEVRLSERAVFQPPEIL